MSIRDVPPKPKWWQLYLTFPLLMGLFLLDTHLNISTGGHEIVQLGSLFLEFGLVQVWLKSNGRALRHMDDEEISRTLRIIEIPPAMPGDSPERSQPLLLPRPTEIPGVLSDTFEMDSVDAKAYAVDQAGEREPRARR